MTEFNFWRARVEDVFMAFSAGFNTWDFPDWDFAKAWEDGLTPTETVHLFIEEMNHFQDYSIDF